MSFLLFPVCKYRIKLFEKTFKLILGQSVNAGCRCPAAAGYKGAAERICSLLIMKRCTDIYPVCPIRIAREKTMGKAWFLLGFEVAEYT
jgi:hypothetical protein